MYCVRSCGRTHRSASAFLLDLPKKRRGSFNDYALLVGKCWVCNAPVLYSNASHAHEVGVDSIYLLQVDAETVAVLSCLACGSDAGAVGVEAW